MDGRTLLLGTQDLIRHLAAGHCQAQQQKPRQPTGKSQEGQPTQKELSQEKPPKEEPSKEKPHCQAQQEPWQSKSKEGHSSQKKSS